MPSQQPKGQLQKQHSLDTGNYIIDKPKLEASTGGRKYDDDDDDDDDDNNNNNNNNNNNSILYYLCAESTAKRPVTETAQFRYR
jgi:hypothetical protein